MGPFQRIAAAAGILAVIILSISPGDALAGPGADITPVPDSASPEPSTAPSQPEPISPLGFSGQSSDYHRQAQRTADGTEATADTVDFLPVPDRWRIGIPGNYIQNTRGSILDPYNQNVLKGDYAIPGTQDKFFSLTATDDTLFEARRLPTPSGVSSVQPGSFQFFGSGDQIFLKHDIIVSFDLFQGDTAYRQRDWEFRATLDGDLNYLHAEETGVVSPDVSVRHDRTDGTAAVQELFVEKRIADLSPNFDFVSIRAGIQAFNSDFRGLLFDDEEPGIRLFGNYDNNRLQYNLAWFHTLEKNTDSGLNTLRFRGQDLFIANLYRQDFLFPGYTAQVSFQTNLDHGGTRYDSNGFLARPAPIGSPEDKAVHAYYIGWAGDGHIGPLNLSHQFYQALGDESFNPIAGRRVAIDAQLAAVELSYDRDWVRFRTSFIYASGDNNPTGGKATGFDSIFDNPNFAGGAFSFFTRQAIPLPGVGADLVNRNSFLPDLRTSKEQGQASFVNPGLLLYNVGVDMDLTPKVKLITNASFLQFASSNTLQLLLNDNKIGRDIGYDLSAAVQYRPFLNNNAIVTLGAACLVPGQGFKEIYTPQTLYSLFTSITVTY